MNAYTLYYASGTLLRITQVVMATEEMAKKWFGECVQWTDVIRARIVAPDGNVLVDQVIEHRIIDDEARELADRMDSVFTAERQFTYPPKRGEPAVHVPMRALANGMERCRCNHLRVEHNGPEGHGRCHAQCSCQRFTRRTP